jgi:hypothetical protein
MAPVHSRPMWDSLGNRGRTLALALAAGAMLIAGQAAIGSAQAATTVSVTPTSPVGTIYGTPFGETETWGANNVWVYENVPAFNLKAGDTLAFDLTAQNDVDIQLDIAMAPTTTNGGDTNAAAFTQIVPNSQIPANPMGNTTTGDYELTFTAQAPFNFAGGGLLIRFSNPGGAFATDPNDSGSPVEGNTAQPSDPSGQFVERIVRDADGVAPWTGDIYTDGGIGGFRLNILDAPPAPPAPPASGPTAPPKKKCKKHKKRTAAAAKKCKKKRR